MRGGSVRIGLLEEDNGMVVCGERGRLMCGEDVEMCGMEG